MDVNANLICDDSDLNLSLVPEVGGFGIDMNHNGLVDKINLDLSIGFDLLDLDGNLDVNFFSSLGDHNVHFHFECSDDCASFCFNSDSLSADCNRPFRLKCTNEFSVSEGKGFSLLKVVGIELLDSLSIFCFSRVFVISEELSIVYLEASLLFIKPDLDRDPFRFY